MSSWLKVNEKKKGLEGTFATKQVVWGIEYDTELETVAYPEMKVMKLRRQLIVFYITSAWGENKQTQPICKKGRTSSKKRAVG